MPFGHIDTPISKPNARGKYIGSVLSKTEKSTTAAGDDTTHMKDYIYDDLLKKSLFNQPATFLE